MNSYHERARKLANQCELAVSHELGLNHIKRETYEDAAKMMEASCQDEHCRDSCYHAKAIRFKARQIMQTVGIIKAQSVTE